jgi:hypothetical protein
MSWTVTASHELMEMMVDPFINTDVFNQTTNTAGIIYAKEVCDAVEADNLGYTINSVLVSDFVLPSWFDGWRAPNSVAFSFKNNVHAPFALASGGYIGAFDVTRGSGWTQLLAETVPGTTSRVTTSTRAAKRGKTWEHQVKSSVTKNHS